MDRQRGGQRRNQAGTTTSRLLSRFFHHVETLRDFFHRVLPVEERHHVDACLDAWQKLRRQQAALAAAAQAGAASTSYSAQPKDALFLEDAWVGVRDEPALAVHVRKPWLGSDGGCLEDHGGLNMHIERALEEAQGHHLRAAARSKTSMGAANVLTLGLREIDELSNDQRPHKVLAGIATTNTHVNPYATQILLRQEWRILAEHLGIDVLQVILNSTSLFVPVSKDSTNLLQILGQPLSNLAEVTNPQEFEQAIADPKDDQRRRRRKRKRNSMIEGEQDGESECSAETSDEKAVPQKDIAAKTHVVRGRPGLVPRKPADIALMRQRMFFARPQRTKHGQAGFSSEHILNGARAYQDSKAPCEGKNDTLLRQRARLLAKHVWPLEYGLRTCLLATVSSSAKAAPPLFEDSAARSRDIHDKGKMRTPRRLHQAVHLLEIMLTKHRRLDYQRLLDSTCRRAMPHQRLTEEMRHDIVESLCEVQPSQRFPREVPLTQAQGPSQRPVPYIGDGTSLQASEKPRFTKYKASQNCVSLFAQLVLRSIIPIDLLGSHENLRHLLRCIDCFVKLRRFETMNLHQVMQGFCVSDCSWTLPQDKQALSQRPTQAESRFRQRLVQQMVYFIFDSLLIPLLRTTFYATESARFRNRVLFFRQDDWARISRPILDCLKEECFEVIPKHKAVAIMSRREFGYSYVRLLPKEVGMRPIVNLRRRSTKITRKMPSEGQADKDRGTWGQVTRQKSSINSILGILFRVLAYEKEAERRPTTSTVSGPQDIHARLLNYKSRLTAQSGEALPKLYCVKVDIAGAFDCIDQDKLMEIVEDLVHHDRYFVQKFVQIVLRGGHASKKWSSLARPESGWHEFSASVAQLSAQDCLRNVIFSDNVSTMQSDRERLLWLLREHVSNNLVKMGQQYCVQRVGIPQGSTLSTMLCNFYLERMEQELGLVDERDPFSRYDLLMRYTDDFIFLTPDKMRAHRFLSLLRRGQDDFNCAIAPGKTVVNFDIDPLFVEQDSDLLDQGTGEATLVTDPCISWCSYLINMTDLSVRHDISRHAWTSIADALTIPHRSPCATFLAHIISTTVQRRNLPVFLDSRLNGVTTVLFNIHQSFALGGIKLVSAARLLLTASTRGKDRYNRSHARAHLDQYMSRLIASEIDHAYAHARARLARMSEGTGNVEQSQPPVHAWPLGRSQFAYLALHALDAVFQMRPSTRHSAAHNEVRNRLAIASKCLSSSVYQSDQPQIHTHTLIDAARQAWSQTQCILRTIKLT